MAYEFKTEPKPWQQRGYDLTRDWITAATLLDPGMGKTKLILDSAGHAFASGRIDTLVVIAPNGVHEVWPEEAEKHLNVPHAAAFYRSGTVNNPIKAVLAARGKALKILAVNTEALQYKSGVAMVRAWMTGRRVMMAVDEAQKIRTPSASRTRNITLLGKDAAMRRIATGTIVIRGLENLYAPYRFLHPGIIGQATYTAFKNQYCIERGEFREIVGYRNQDELLGKIGRRTFFAYEDEMGLEEPVVTERVVPLSDEQRRLYADIRATFMAELTSGALVEAPLAITRLQKFQQIVGGHIRKEDGSWEPVPNHRLAACVDVVQNAPSKTIVWAQWQPDIEQLAAAFDTAGVRYVTYYGRNTPTQNKANLVAFKTDPGIHVFLATQSSGGAGLTINEAKHTVNYTHTHNTEHAWQAKKRNHRLGQESVIHVTNLVSRGTVDVSILRSNERKWDIASVLRDPSLMEAWLDGRFGS